MESAKALLAGSEPPSIDDPDAYLVRAGGAVSAEDAAFDAVMKERFGDALGLVREV